MMMKIEPVMLEGKYVKLKPLSIEDLTDLSEVGLDEEIWRWIPEQITTVGEMRGYIEKALDEQKRGLSLPLATIEKQSNKAIGSTRFANFSAENRRVEIGWTWIGRAWQRTFINTEAKFLMLRHAFETWKCLRVELKTDALNTRSRQAILRLGAQQEGIFRQHIITQSGRLRDTVYFSILDYEWENVKASLLSKLQQNYET